MTLKIAPTADGRRQRSERSQVAIVEAALMEIAEAKDKQEFTTRWGPFNVMHLPPWLEQQD